MNWNTIFSGEPRACCLNAGGSEFLTALITRKCWWFGCIRKFFAPRVCPRNCATEKTSGKSGIDPSWISKDTFIATEREPSKCSCTFRMEEQRKRFLERIDEPKKNWKFSAADIHERKFWKRYMEAYEECLSATSTIMRHGTQFPPTIKTTPD